MNRIYILLTAVLMATALNASAQSKNFKLGQWTEIHNSVVKELNRSYVDSLPVDRMMRASSSTTTIMTVFFIFTDLLPLRSFQGAASSEHCRRCRRC